MKHRVAGEEEAFREVAGYALFWVTDGGEVDFLVPTEEQVQVGEDLVLL
jgi:hypothetical protein